MEAQLKELHLGSSFKNQRGATLLYLMPYQLGISFLDEFNYSELITYLLVLFCNKTRKATMFTKFKQQHLIQHELTAEKSIGNANKE